MKLDQFLTKLDRVKSTGTNQWVACCPHHGDKRPSLAIKHDTVTGKVLVKCWAGCDIEDIMAAVGMKVSDLFPDKPEYTKPTRSYFGAETIVKSLYHDLFTLRYYARQLEGGHELAEVIARLDEALTYIEPGYVKPVPSWGKK
jgi:hypothetical protein